MQLCTLEFSDLLASVVYIHWTNIESSKIFSFNNYTKSLYIFFWKLNYNVKTLIHDLGAIKILDYDSILRTLSKTKLKSLLREGDQGILLIEILGVRTTTIRLNPLLRGDQAFPSRNTRSHKCKKSN